MTRLFLLALVPFAAPALAAPPAAMRATLATPLDAPRQIDGRVARWSCAGATCTGPATNGRLGDPRACRELVKLVGPVSGFTGLRGDLTADERTRCNASAASAQ